MALLNMDDTRTAHAMDGSMRSVWQTLVSSAVLLPDNCQKCLAIQSNSPIAGQSRRKQFFRFAIDVLADSHPDGPEVGRRIIGRLLPS